MFTVPLNVYSPFKCLPKYSQTIPNKNILKQHQTKIFLNNTKQKYSQTTPNKNILKQHQTKLNCIRFLLNLFLFSFTVFCLYSVQELAVEKIEGKLS